MTSTTDAENPAMNVFWENVRTVLYALALAMVIRFMIAQPYRIPSASMEPTLEEGDYIVVTKWSYGYGPYSFAPLEGLAPPGRMFGTEPERGDIVVFRPTLEPDRDFVKRLIGLPGDRVRVTGGRLEINGVPVERESLGLTPFQRPDGQMVERPGWRETLPNGVTYTTFDDDPAGPLDNTRIFVVPEGHYFLMGDNRDNSEDSRTYAVGMVPYENLVGPAQAVIVSFDKTTNIFQPWTLFTGFRTERFLRPLE